MRTGIIHNTTTIPDHEIGNVILERDAPDPANGTYILFESRGGRVQLVPVSPGDRLAIVTIEWREPEWSFEASGSENDNSRGELLINGKSIELLAESPSNLIRILIAELKSHGLTAKPLEHYLQFVENERGAHDPWSLLIDQNS